MVATRWASDPLSYGSYSSVAVGSAGPEDYDAMAADVGRRCARPDCLSVTRIL